MDSQLARSAPGATAAWHVFAASMLPVTLPLADGTTLTHECPDSDCPAWGKSLSRREMSSPWLSVCLMGILLNHQVIGTNSS